MHDELKLPFDLQKNESVLLFARRHPAFLVIQLVKQAAFALIPIAALLTIFALTAGLDGRKGQVAGLISLVWFVFWAVRAYFAWYRYNHDIWVVSNQRVVDSIKKNWFHHAMASADLDDVEDISIRKAGIFATAFNFGDLLLQTAGERPNFVLSGIPDPSRSSPSSISLAMPRSAPCAASPPPNSPAFGRAFEPRLKRREPPGPRTPAHATRNIEHPPTPHRP